MKKEDCMHFISKPSLGTYKFSQASRIYFKEISFIHGLVSKDNQKMKLERIL